MTSTPPLFPLPARRPAAPVEAAPRARAHASAPTASYLTPRPAPLPGELDCRQCGAGTGSLLVLLCRPCRGLLAAHRDAHPLPPLSHLDPAR